MYGTQGYLRINIALICLVLYLPLDTLSHATVYLLHITRGTALTIQYSWLCKSSHIIILVYNGLRSLSIKWPCA